MRIVVRRAAPLLILAATVFLFDSVYAIAWGAVASTLLAAVGMGHNQLTGGLLYYLLSSTVAVSALFLLTDLIERWRNDGFSVAPYERKDDAPFLSADLVHSASAPLDDGEQEVIGEVIPAAAAFLGLAFITCTLVVAGLPPLSGAEEGHAP